LRDLAVDEPQQLWKLYLGGVLGDRLGRSG
jgi:hypothetical protein